MHVLDIELDLSGWNYRAILCVEKTRVEPARNIHNSLSNRRFILERQSLELECRRVCQET
jgi:hypothetical protein